MYAVHVGIQKIQPEEKKTIVLIRNVSHGCYEIQNCQVQLGGNHNRIWRDKLFSTFFLNVRFDGHTLQVLM